METAKLAHIMDVAQGKAPADLIIRNAKVVNVFTKQIEEVEVAIAADMIAWLGKPDSEKPRPAMAIYDAAGKFLIPGLIDAHCHIEMSFMSAIPFAQAVIPHGTTTAVLDMHDICNTGINCMHSFARELACTPLKACLMIPPCVPGTPTLEEAGANMTLKDMQEAMHLPNAHGIAEAMDFNRILEQEPEIMSILAWGREQNLRIDGHCPELVGDDLQAYIAAGILTDHESVSLEEMLEKYRLGMKVILRRGSLQEPVRAGDFTAALADTANVLLATDGCIFLDDILDTGHMNRALQAIVAEGVDPVTAVQMGTINVARAYGIDHRVGSISPGRKADLVLVSDLESFDVVQVFVDGKPFNEDNFAVPSYHYPQDVLNTVKLGEVRPETFWIKAPTDADEVKVRVMTIIAGTVATREEFEMMPVKNSLLQPDTGRDLLKVAVFDRYREDGYHALGIVRGFGLKQGAFGGSVGQDSQNLAVVGTNDEDMALVVNAIRSMQGGIVLAAEGQIIAKVELPIGGIMSNIDPRELQLAFNHLHEKVFELGSRQDNPSFDLSLLLTCAVIPELKITNRGLVDALSGQFVPLIIE
ncbi:MAG TPA: adenine deaminase C-terminal domain-containing protein [Syntrophomonas sp.]|nr:adenine deaminase C-terminal domain-containing protein [Syntrophomonas sp.]